MESPNHSIYIAVPPKSTLFFINMDVFGYKSVCVSVLKFNNFNAQTQKKPKNLDSWPDLRIFML